MEEEDLVMCVISGRQTEGKHTWVQCLTKDLESLVMATKEWRPEKSILLIVQNARYRLMPNVNYYSWVSLFCLPDVILPARS